MKAIVLAGGEGTRLRPLTYTRPKSLMPIADRPCIDYILRSVIQAGISKVIIATSYLSDKLIKAIGDGLGYEASIVYTFEKTPAGTAGAVKRVEDFIDGTFVVAMGDVVADIDIGALVDFHKNHKAAATIALTEAEDPTQYGIAAVNEKGRILRFQEKPKKEEAFSKLVNAGIYVLEKRVIEFIPEGEMFDFSKNLFPKLLAKKIPIYGMPVKGIWMDIGRPADLMRASIEMVNRRGKEAAIPGIQTTGRILAKGGISAGEDARIEGPSFIGRDVRLAARAEVVKSCLHDGTTVGDGGKVSDSLVMDLTSVGKMCEVTKSIVGSSCEIGDEAKVLSCVIGDGVKVSPGTTLRDMTLS